MQEKEFKKFKKDYERVNKVSQEVIDAANALTDKIGYNAVADLIGVNRGTIWQLFNRGYSITTAIQIMEAYYSGK